MLVVGCIHLGGLIGNWDSRWNPDGGSFATQFVGRAVTGNHSDLRHMVRGPILRDPTSG